MMEAFRLICHSRILFPNGDLPGTLIYKSGLEKGGIGAARDRTEATLGKKGEDSSSPTSKAEEVGAQKALPRQREPANPGWERMEARFIWGLSWTHR